MKPSELLTSVIDHLGPKEHWCQGREFVGDERAETMFAGWQADGALGAARDVFLANNPAHTRSLCLEGAISVARAQVGLTYGTSDEALKTLRQALRDTFAEQFPEILEEQRQEAQLRLDKFTESTHHDFMERARAAIEAKVVDPASSTSIPNYNDSPAMTYEGVLSVCEKTLATLKEQGR